MINMIVFVWEVKNGSVCLFISGGKTQVMGEIKVALKKEVKTEGDQLVLEILQCRNITYKFKSPDHLPGVCVCVCGCLNRRARFTDLPFLHRCALRSVCQAVRGERRHSEEDHQKEDQSLPTWQRAVFQRDLQVPTQPYWTLHTGTTGSFSCRSQETVSTGSDLLWTHSLKNILKLENCSSVLIKARGYKGCLWYRLWNYAADCVFYSDGVFTN